MTSRSFTVHPVPSMGAEDVLVGPDGTVWTGTEDGAIWALDPATGNVRRVADTGGRPLGIELLPDGDLVVCDAERGLLQVSPTSGDVEVLLDVADVRGRRGAARPGRRPADALLQQRRRRRRRHDLVQ